MDLYNSFKIFKNINFPRQYFVRNFNEAKKRAKLLKFPAVIKVSSKIIHKTEKGLVKVTYNEKDFIRKLEEIKKVIEKEKIEFNYILLQQFVKGIELFIGIKNDRTFGKVIGIGLGGINIEILKDVSFRKIPISKKDLKEMINETSLHYFFKGFRGIKLNFELFYKYIKEIEKVAKKLKFNSIDFNPVIGNNKNFYFVDIAID